jgi:nitrile hydratase beta subunit
VIVNGAHDLGGSKGLGPVPVEASEGGFHEPWESRVVGAIIGAIAKGAFNVDEMRAHIEELHPIVYLDTPYFEKWLYALERGLVDGGVLSRDEIVERHQQIAEDPGAPLPKRQDDELRESMRRLIEQGAPITRELDRAPAFARGDRVRTRVIRIERNGEQHTRLPGYAQGKEGVIELVLPAMPLPDANVSGDGERPEYVYAVRFAARDLWPDADERSSVCADLWESYLERSDG